MKSLKAWQLFCIRKVISKVYTNNKQKTTCFDKSFFVWRNQGRSDLNHLNADVRWTSACRQLDGDNSISFLSNGKKNATNLAGTCSDWQYLKCARETNKKRPVSTGRFLFGEIKDRQIWTIKCNCPVDSCLPPARWRQPHNFSFWKNEKCKQIWPVPLRPSISKMGSNNKTKRTSVWMSFLFWKGERTDLKNEMQ